MRILLICEGDAESPHGSFSGITHSVLSELRRLGHDVRTADVELAGWRRWLGAAVAFAPRRARWGVRYRLGPHGFKIRSRLAQAAFDSWPDADAVLQIGATFRLARPRAPVVMYCDSNIRMAERGIATGHSEAVHLTSEELASVIAREAGVYGQASAVMTLSERLRRSFIEDFGLKPDRVVAVYAGPNFERGKTPIRGPRDAHRPPTILFVGRQFERKGGDLLLRAFDTVRLTLPDARLLIVGPSEVPEIPGVECLGFLRKDVQEEDRRLHEAYANADVFCLPTRYEPFGIAYLEAMYFGLPCVGPDAWAVPEMIEDGTTGYIVPPEDHAALAQRLITLLRDPALAARMGARGRERAERTFTWPATAERMMRVLARAVTDVPRDRARA